MAIQHFPMLQPQLLFLRRSTEDVIPNRPVGHHFRFYQVRFGIFFQFPLPNFVATLEL